MGGGPGKEDRDRRFEDYEGLALLVLLLGPVSGVADLAPAMHGNTTVNVGMVSAAHVDVRLGWSTNKQCCGWA